MKLFLILILSSIYLSATAQDSCEKAAIKSNGLFEKRAEFPGGCEKFRDFVIGKLDHADAAAWIITHKELKASFTVDTNGILKNIRLLSKPGYSMEESIVNVIKSSPKWSPAIKNNQKVPYNVTVILEIDVAKEEIDMSVFRKSDANYLFKINGKTFTAKEATDIIGQRFSGARIARITHFPNEDDAGYLQDTWLVEICQ